MAITQTQRAPGGELFGHPRGLTFLFTTEMWERFSYYGMRSLLVLYMVKFILLPDNAGTVIGLGALRGFYEGIFGPLGTQPFASHIYGLYTALVYATPLIGGRRCENRRRNSVSSMPGSSSPCAIPCRPEIRQFCPSSALP